MIDNDQLLKSNSPLATNVHHQNMKDGMAVYDISIADLSRRRWHSRINTINKDQDDK